MFFHLQPCLYTMQSHSIGIIIKTLFEMEIIKHDSSQLLFFKPLMPSTAPTALHCLFNHSDPELLWDNSFIINHECNVSKILLEQTRSEVDINYK